MTKTSENKRLRNFGLAGSIGFGRPFAVRHLLMMSMFQEAPIIRPYAIIVGAMNVSIAAANQTASIVPVLL